MNLNELHKRVGLLLAEDPSLGERPVVYPDGGSFPDLNEATDVRVAAESYLSGVMPRRGRCVVIE